MASDLTPYQTLKVRVTFTQGSQSFQTYAFWRSGQTFSIRAAFPTPGVWTWSTQCLQPAATCAAESYSASLGGLNNATGSVTVEAFNSTIKRHIASPLYLKGMIQPVAPAAGNRGYFKYSGTNEAFEWLGDTAWSAPIRATLPQWTQYIQRLSSAGFTVVQIATPVDYMDGTSGAQPVTVPPNTPLKPFNCPSPEPSQIPNVACSMNDAYWNHFDDMVKAANDQGIVVVVVGLMERVIEANDQYPDLTATKTFARTLASRLAGSHVILSPAFDHSPHKLDDTMCASQSPQTCLEQRIHAIGAEILDATHNGTSSSTPRQLIANHSAGDDLPADLLRFQSDSWLSFFLFQSGQAANLAKEAAGASSTEAQRLQEQHRLIFERAATFPTYFTTKPSVNAELIYEGGQAPCALCPATCNITTRKCTDQSVAGMYYAPDARSQGKGLWMSFFNGATGGTIGVAGTSDWQTNGQTSFNSQSWTAVKRLKAFEELTSWTALKPSASSRIPLPTPASLSAWQKIYAIENSAKTQVAVYFPERIAANVRVSDLPACRTAQWFDPRTDSALRNATPQGPCTTGTNAFCTYNPPAGGGDWVLLLRKAASCATATNSLSVTAGTVALDDDDTGWALFSQKLDAEGEPFGDATQITDAQIGASPKRVQLLQGPGGANLVAWESEEPEEGTPSSIVAYQLDSDGLPVGDLITVGTEGEGRATDPAITLTPGGNYAIAWSTWSDEGNEIHAQTLDSAGFLSDDSTVTVLPPGSEPVEPMVSADSSGNLAVAWTEVSDTGATIGVRRLSAAATPVGSVENPILQIDGTFESLSSAELVGGSLNLQWETHDSTGSTQGVFACGFDALGQPTGDVLYIWQPDSAGDS
ncbi:MAG TPA: DUF4038 domain-containing protein [Thermoanaerobaculia bacterium]|jgi:hypothetical protein|nr:DUF4038 domain-containing protein [Thermoanaerobaculia bacterium]